MAACLSNRWGAGCGHPTEDHIGEGMTTHGDCCCCTWRHNDPSHVDTCLDCSIMHGKRQVRIRGIAEIPLVAHVEPFIPEGLKTAFWKRYLGKYFDDALEASK